MVWLTPAVAAEAIGQRSRRRAPASRALITGFLAGAILSSGALHAQQTPGVLSGLVRDADGRLLESVLVALDPSTTNQRLTRTDAEGRFRFSEVSAGSHEVAVAWIGFRTDVRTVAVPAEGLHLEIVLRQNVTALDTLRVRVGPTGILGTVIAHETFQPLAGAEVQVIGASSPARTGADGRFAFGQVPHGSHVVYVTLRGYQGRMLSVVVPRDSAVELALVLDPIAGDSEKRFSQLLTEFDRRRRWMTGNHAAVVSRHELAGRDGMSLFDALRYSPTFMLKGLRLDEDACMYVDGQFKSAMSAKDITVGEIEAVEVYGTGADYTNTVTERHKQRPRRMPPGGICGGTPAASLSSAVPLDQSVMNFRGGPRGDPSRVEAIVVWRKR